MYCDSASVTRPSANTPIVCVTVTVAPSATAWRARAARADEVRRHHRLAVAGRERVQRAPAERAASRSRAARPRPTAASLEQTGEAVAARARRSRRAAPWRRAPPACRRRARRAKLALAAVERAVEQVAAGSGAGRRWDRRSGAFDAHGGPVAGRGDDRLPADPAGERVVARARRARGVVARQRRAASSTRVVFRPPWPGREA